MKMAMDEILTGTATPAQIGSFITALRLKGETVDEIAGAAKAIRAKATKVSVNNHMVNLDRDEINIENETILDIVGTGGDGSGSLNLSTGAGLLAAACGVRVVKHGNRSVSSKSGSLKEILPSGITSRCRSNRAPSSSAKRYAPYNTPRSSPPTTVTRETTATRETRATPPTAATQSVSLAGCSVESSLRRRGIIGR